ncbi:MAG TPA: 30S ribosomal protein S8 [Patescibacteria group bacterium]|nr:30S ribosomal protein S8 [Patescibacteria group bacterium]
MAYVVSDVLIRIKNASLARRRTVILPYAKLAKEMCRVLIHEGFLQQVTEETIDKKRVLVAEITYDKRLPVLTDVKILSKPSLRQYAKALDGARLKGKGIGITVVSTNKGVMTGKEASQKGLGGELLFTVW